MTVDTVFIKKKKLMAQEEKEEGEKLADKLLSFRPVTS